MVLEGFKVDDLPLESGVLPRGQTPGQNYDPAEGGMVQQQAKAMAPHQPCRAQQQGGVGLNSHRVRASLS